MESSEARAARLADNTECEARRRAEETDEERTARLADNIEREARHRAEEMDEERTARLADNTGCEERHRAEETGTGTHVRARESEGTACVVVVSGTRFEIFLFCFVLFARTATHERARTYGHALVLFKFNYMLEH